MASGCQALTPGQRKKSSYMLVTNGISIVRNAHCNKAPRTHPHSRRTSLRIKSQMPSLAIQEIQKLTIPMRP